MAGSKRSHHQMNGRDSTLRHGHSTAACLPSESSGRASSHEGNLRERERGKDLTSLPRSVSFEPSASIVLVGIRGVGKTTLGILVATAYSRRLVDTEREFKEATGSTVSVYRKTKGVSGYRERHVEIFEATLQRHSIGAVIVCAFSDLEGDGARVLRKFGETHAVIYISRDVQGISSMLNDRTDEQIQKLISGTAPLLRSCSNYEFFNLTEAHDEAGLPEGRGQSDDTAGTESFLTLKRVQRDFIRLVRNIVGDDGRGRSHHSVYPLSQASVQSRKYTFAVTLNASQVLEGNIDFDLAQIGADAVELLVDISLESRKDYFSDMAKAFASVRRATILPIMLTIDNVNISVEGQVLFDVFDFCLRLGPELCTIDLALNDWQLAHFVRTKGFTSLVGRVNLHEHQPRGWKDATCMEAYLRASQIGLEFVKIEMPATSTDDCFQLHEFKDRIAALQVHPKPALIAYNTGLKGKTSRCFNQILTSVKPTRSLNEPREPDSTSGDVSAKELTQALFASFIMEPLRFYIYGANVSYSLSPAMHNAAFEACGMQHVFNHKSSDSIDALMDLIKSDDFGGAAVAQPYKTSILEAMDELSPHAKAIGAVNTVIPLRELSTNLAIPSEVDIISRQVQCGPVKALYGFNTDWIGVRACIRRGLSPANTVRPHTTALVCGVGGMARASIYALLSLGIRQVYVCNRTTGKAATLARYYNDLIARGDIVDISSADDAAQVEVHALKSLKSAWPANVRAPAVIVSCIPRRDVGDVTPGFSLQETWLTNSTGGVVLEVAYGQSLSSIEPQVRSRARKGWIFMDGYDFIPEQAFSQFELFTGRRSPRRLMRDEMKKQAV